MQSDDSTAWRAPPRLLAILDGSSLTDQLRRFAGCPKGVILRVLAVPIQPNKFGPDSNAIRSPLGTKAKRPFAEWQAPCI